jgi:hypothetical protein
MISSILQTAHLDPSITVFLFCCSMAVITALDAEIESIAKTRLTPDSEPGSRANSTVRQANRPAWPD